MTTEALGKVERELRLYTHPFFEFSASDQQGNVEVHIESKIADVHSPRYHFTLTPREIEHPQFRWSFQSVLYGSLNDYVVELFTRVPGDAP